MFIIQKDYCYTRNNTRNMYLLSEIVSACDKLIISLFLLRHPIFIVNIINYLIQKDLKVVTPADPV